MGRCAIRSLVMRIAVALVVLMIAPAVKAEELRIRSGFIPQSDASRPFIQEFERTTGLTLSFQESEFKEHLRNLERGAFEAIASVLPLEELLELKSAGGAANGSLFRATTIAQFPLVAVVDKSNPITKLSKSQLKDIFTGKIVNWQELGGVGEEIRPIIPWEYSVRSSFRHQIMDGQAYAPVMDNRGPTKEEAASGDIDTITIMPVVRVDDSVKVVATPKIIMTYSIITLGEPSSKVQKLIDYARGAGLKYITVDK